MTGSARERALARIRRVALELGDVRERVVFIGGTVLPLLVEVESRFSSPRITKDVDAVAGTARSTEKHRLEQAMRQARFRNDPGGHMGRWRSPSGETFDLSFAGDHAGATGSRVDAIGIQSAVTLEGEPPVRCLSGPGFFLMKMAAFFDRGQRAPFESKDLADLAVLLAGRPQLTLEIPESTGDGWSLGSEFAQRLLAVTDLAGALRSHFRDRRPIPPDTPDILANEVLEYLRRMAAGRGD